MSAPLLEVDGLEVAFPTDDGLVTAVRGVSFSLAGGEALGIAGESGSGKSVTSLAIMGLLPPSAQVSGSVRLGGEELLGLGDRALSRIRGQRIAMVFQDPLTSLTPVHTVGRQIEEALTAHDRRLSRRSARSRAIELLDRVGIPDPAGRADAYPHELSGGMRQRAVIAIAMANDPDVIIADEPTTALDVTVQAQVLEALEVARRETGAALMLITHDLGIIAGHADRVAVMYAGRVVEQAPVDTLFGAPRMPYTLGLLGSLPRLDAERSHRLTPILGTPPSLVNLPAGCPFAPRCPLAREDCVAGEPIATAIAADHVVACHHHGELVGRSSAEVFATTAADVGAADLTGGAA